MIASVRGEVAAVGPDIAVVEVAGVGFAIQCAPATLARLRVGQPAQLATSLVVREDALTLYGFTDAAERELFELLQTASGVGPRLALAILAVHAPQAVRQAIATSDTATLTRVPGIGKKGAERLVLELRDRIGSVVADIPTDAAGGGQVWQEQVQEALVGLGWSVREAQDTVSAVAADLPDGSDVTASAVPTLLKQAIRRLGRTR